MIRVFTISVVAAACSSPLAAASNEVFEFVQKSCVACHNATVKSGNVDLKSLHTAKTFEEDRENWERVVEKLKTGQTPPPGGARPPVVGSMQCAFSFYRWSRRRIRMFPRLRAAKAPGNSRPCF